MKTSLCPITLREANAFVESFHRHSSATQGCKFAIGLASEIGLVGVAIVGRPVARKLDDGYTAEVTRVCVHEDAPKGSCSKLYGACWRAWRAMGGRKLVTYTLQTESGASLRGAGWTIVGEVKGAGASAWQGPNRSRDWQPIYGQQKLRWEVAA